MEMTGAAQIEDVQERTRVLASLQDCEAPPINLSKSTQVLIEDAIAVARAGDCTTMKKIAAEVRARERGTIRDARFVNDVAVQGCYIR
jgi:hypothetical protein